MRREFDHSAVGKATKTVNFAAWIEEVLRKPWPSTSVGKRPPLSSRCGPDPEFVFHFLYPVFGKADSAAEY